ncbi:flagellar basal body rod C-terminal domain-containing protein [Phenylobacterium sp.]|uniref:flagellar basal body rod C-terminal domain-containing protein n=1 Tax=Phenylobacterium sp. TaxID=1871053 RepID=UPI003BAACD44
MNPIATAQYGLFAATRRFEASAQRTAQMGDPTADVDYTNEVVEQITAKHEFSANLAVIRTADEMTGDLLDILA